MAIYRVVVFSFILPICLFVSLLKSINTSFPFVPLHGKLSIIRVMVCLPICLFVYQLTSFLSFLFMAKYQSFVWWFVCLFICFFLYQLTSPFLSNLWTTEIGFKASTGKFYIESRNSGLEESREKRLTAAKCTASLILAVHCSKMHCISYSFSSLHQSTLVHLSLQCTAAKYTDSLITSVYCTKVQCICYPCDAMQGAAVYCITILLTGCIYHRHTSL